MSRSARAGRKARKAHQVTSPIATVEQAKPRSPYANKFLDDRTRTLLRSLIAFGIARGWTQLETADQIKQRLGIEMSRKLVGFHYREIMAEAADRLVRDPDQMLATQLLRIDRAVSSLWDAWEKSGGQRDIETTRTRRTALDKEGKPIGRASDMDDAMVRTEQRDPDPRYMTALARWEELRSKLLGLLREPKSDDDKPPPPPATINVHVKVASGATLNVGGPSEPDSLPPPTGQVIDVTPTHAPALAAPSPPGTYR